MNIYIFDFDGVIGNTFELTAKFAASSLRIPMAQAREYVVEHSQHNRKTTLIKKLAKNIYIRKLKQYIKTQNEDYVFPGVLEHIERLPGPVYIVSRNHSEIVKTILAERQLMFADIYGYNNASSKVAALQKILKSTGAGASEVTFVSDTLGDYKEMTEQALPPSQVHLVTWGFNDKAMILAHDPSIQLLQSPLEIASLYKPD